MIGVDQDAIDASRISNTSTSQIFTKKEPNGDAIVGLFNTSSTPETISTSASALGLPPGTDYAVKDLWTHQTTETTGAIGPNVPPHGVALYRVSPLHNPAQAPPNASFSLSGLSTIPAGQPVTATESFTDNGDLAALRVKLALNVPAVDGDGHVAEFVPGGPDRPDRAGHVPGHRAEAGRPVPDQYGDRERQLHLGG